MQPHLLPSLLMSAIAFLTVAVILRGLLRALPRTGLPASDQRRLRTTVLLAAATWIVLTGVLAAAGVFTAAGLPPRPLVAMLAGTVLVVFASFRPGGRALLRAVPLHALLYLQSFRIAVELVLWLGHTRGIIPQAMTFEGRNWDLAVGLAALPAGYLVQRRTAVARWVHLGFNVLGLVSLSNIAVVAIGHMPGLVPPGAVSMGIVGTFPFIYLPAVLVLVALAGHILSLRQLAPGSGKAAAPVEIPSARQPLPLSQSEA